MQDHSIIEDAVAIAMERGFVAPDLAGITGFAVIELVGPDGELKVRRLQKNLITDAGDGYEAAKVIAAIAPANAAAPTAAVCMKLGTGSTAVAKAGAGGALVTYLTASNVAFDATWPKVVNLGAGLGQTAEYKSTWAAGVATSATINEAVIANDNANATSTAANTYSRILTGLVNKGALDSLAITWSWKFLGA
jgi:hypothetical protein